MLGYPTKSGETWEDLDDIARTAADTLQISGNSANLSDASVLCSAVPAWWDRPAAIYTKSVNVENVVQNSFWYRPITVRHVDTAHCMVSE